MDEKPWMPENFIRAAAGQQVRSAEEQRLPEWYREHLDRERMRPRNIDDVLRAISSLEERIKRIEQFLVV